MAHTIQTYPSLSLVSLQESPQASHFFNAYQTRLLPTTDHIPNQKTYTSQTRILKHSNSKESSLETVQPRAVSTKKAEVSNPPALKNTPANEKFLKFLKGIREERVSSEQRLQKTVENFTKLEAEPKEKVKWKKMVETGQYIGSRGNEKKDIRLSGRALSREKNFQSMRKKMTDLKYEMKSCNVIKHLTSNLPPDVSNLAQPILPFFDGRPARPANEITLIKDMSSLDIEDVKHELIDVHFDTIDSPVVAEKDLVMTYNKEQLKKLKGGINYMNRWIIKNRVKSPGESHRSNKVLPNTSNNNIREVALGNESREKSTEELAVNFLSPLNSTPSRRKSQFKKPRVQERDQKVDPHEEFLKRIGLSDMDIPKGNYFATSTNKESIKTLPYRIEITSEDEGPRMFSQKLESPSSQIPSPYMIPERFSRFARERIMSAGLNESDMSKTLHENDSSALYKTLTLSQTTSAGLKIRTSPMNRSYFSPKSSAFFTKGTPTQKKNASHVNLSAENIQMMSKYNQISNECDSSVKLGSEIQMNLQKDYAVVTEKLTKMNQVQREDWFIDLQIKNDIFAEMQNTPGVTTKLRKKVNSKFAQNKNM